MVELNHSDSSDFDSEMDDQTKRYEEDDYLNQVYPNETAEDAQERRRI